MTDLINQLKRELEYEKQFRSAIISDSLSYYEINLTTDTIEKDFLFYDEHDNYVSYLNYIGLEAPCTFTHFLEVWSQKIIDSDTRKKLSNLQQFTKKLIEMFENGKREYVVNYWGKYKDGKRIFIDQTFILTKAENGDIHALSIVKDYTKIKLLEDKNYQEELERYAYFDPITNGYNYVKFKDKLKNSSLSGSIICMDIHSFKVINSVCGVQEGDKVIKRIWEVIFSRIRKKRIRNLLLRELSPINQRIPDFICNTI